MVQFGNVIPHTSALLILIGNLVRLRRWIEIDTFLSEEKKRHNEIMKLDRPNDIRSDVFRRI